MIRRMEGLVPYYAPAVLGNAQRAFFVETMRRIPDNGRGYMIPTADQPRDRMAIANNEEGPNSPRNFRNDEPEKAGAPRRWSRAAFGTVCVAVFALMGVAVASTWDGLVDRLARSPAPTSPSLASDGTLRGDTSAQRALAEARRRLDSGQPAAALRALDAVRVGDPEYPFASQLRSHALRMLGAAPVASATGGP
jgi:hypothetical protein